MIFVYRVAWRALIVSIFVFLIAPIAVVVLAAFSTTDYLIFPPQGLTLAWFTDFDRLSRFIDALLFSLKVAAGATLIALLLGTWIALVLARISFRGHQQVSILFLAPIALPELALAIGLLQYFSLAGNLRGFLALLLAHSIICTPYAVRAIGATAVRLDSSMEAAARTLGAAPWQVLRDVTLPLLRPGLVAAALMSFTISFDNVVISTFLASPGEISLPALLLGEATATGLNTRVAAVCALLVGVMLLVVIVVDRLVGMPALVRTAIVVDRVGS